MNDEKDVARMDTMGDSTDSRTASTVAPVSHTPLPWHIGPYPGHISAEDRRLVASCRGHQDNRDDTAMDTNDANAEFIVRAVNAHGDMLAALKGIEQFAQDQIIDIGASWQEGCGASVADLRRWSAVLSAIAKADGSQA
jgi:hypothetical protein